MKRTIVFYTTVEGKCPVKDFLDALPGKAAQKVTWVLRLVEELDVIPVTYFKKLTGTDEIWECRIQFGSNTYRLFCFMVNGDVVVLTHGLMKKTQKTPKGEIEKAESYRLEFLRRRR